MWKTYSLKKHSEIILDTRKLQHKDIGNLPKFIELVSIDTRIIALGNLIAPFTL